MVRPGIELRSPQRQTGEQPPEMRHGPQDNLKMIVIKQNLNLSVPVALRSVPAWLLVSRVWVPVRKWVLVSRVCCVDSGVCDGLITHSEESYGVYVCLIACDLRTSTMRRPVRELDCSATHRQKWKITWTELLPIGVQVLPLIGLWFTVRCFQYRKWCSMIWKNFPSFDGIMNLKTSGKRLWDCSKVVTALDCIRKVPNSSIFQSGYHFWANS
jgi:hypothetical protein